MIANDSPKCQHLTIHFSQPTSQHPSLTIHFSQPTSQHPPLNIHFSQPTSQHAPLNMHFSTCTSHHPTSQHPPLTISLKATVKSFKVAEPRHTGQSPPYTTCTQNITVGINSGRQSDLSTSPTPCNHTQMRHHQHPATTLK